MSGLVKQIDRGLKRYYEHKGVPYVNKEGVGKFAEWAEENEYDTESITEEFHLHPKEISFIEFDEHFPITSTDSSNKMQEIFKILYVCYKEPTAFFYSPDLPDEYSQMGIEKHQLLQQTFTQNNNPNIAIDDHKNEPDPHISYVPVSKKPIVYDDPDDDIYDIDDEDAYYAPQKQARRNIYNYDYDYGGGSAASDAQIGNVQVASEAIYESQLTSSDLSIWLIINSKLRSEYETALNLQNLGNKAFSAADYKNALKCYSKMIMYLGSNGVRELADFCNDTGSDNPLRDTSVVYKGIDKLRMSAYIRMAAVYKKQQNWNKVIEKCSMVLREDEKNIKALLIRGSAYRQKRKFAAAKADLMNAKRSKYVDIEVEMELNALNRNICGKFSDAKEEKMVSISPSFRNNNWPQLPLRDIVFEQWVKGKANDIIDILYPVPLKRTQYKFYSNQEILDMAILWLDIDVAERLIDLNIFDINQQNKTYKLQTYINQLSSGCLLTGFKYEQHTIKFNKLLTILCNNNDIDLELRDIDLRTPLANAIKNSMVDLGNILLKYGANVNDGSVKVEIEKHINDVQDVQYVIRQSLGVLRKNSLNAIEYVISTMYGIKNDKIARKILDFILSSWKEEESVDDID